MSHERSISLADAVATVAQDTQESTDPPDTVGGLSDTPSGEEQQQQQQLAEMKAAAEAVVLLGSDLRGASSTDQPNFPVHHRNRRSVHTPFRSPPSHTTGAPGVYFRFPAPPFSPAKNDDELPAKLAPKTTPDDPEYTPQSTVASSPVPFYMCAGADPADGDPMSRNCDNDWSNESSAAQIRPLPAPFMSWVRRQYATTLPTRAELDRKQQQTIQSALSAVASSSSSTTKTKKKRYRSLFSRPVTDTRKSSGAHTSRSTTDSHGGDTSTTRSRRCASCQTSKTPVWRDHPNGTPLCNACGIRFRKFLLLCSSCFYVPRGIELQASNECTRCHSQLPEPENTDQPATYARPAIATTTNSAPVAGTASTTE